MVGQIRASPQCKQPRLQTDDKGIGDDIFVQSLPFGKTTGSTGDLVFDRPSVVSLYLLPLSSQIRVAFLIRASISYHFFSLEMSFFRHTDAYPSKVYFFSGETVISIANTISMIPSLVFLIDGDVWV